MPLLAAALVLVAGAGGAVRAAGDGGGEKKWWEERREGADLHYPHKLHMEVMERRGDLCMACHPFSPLEGARNVRLVERLTVISNEPLKAVCHRCHLVEVSAPGLCSICHRRPETVRPRDHGFDFSTRHGVEAVADKEDCARCHVNASFCTDCHFRRDASRRRVHVLGFRFSHGLAGRLQTARCGACHGAAYCRRCHERGR